MHLPTRIEKKFPFATWMFTEASFSKEQARIRGRMMVVYMMGESTLIPDSMASRKEFLRPKFEVLTSPEK